MTVFKSSSASIYLLNLSIFHWVRTI